MTNRFTGRHMWALMLGFFGIIIAVNFTMAWFASSTFGGTVVDNSYVASQKFNGWLQEGRSQKALGWTVKISLDSARHVRISTPVAGAALTGSATHPLGRMPEQALHFVPSGAGRFRSAAPLPAGRYLVRVHLSTNGRSADFQSDIPA